MEHDGRISRRAAAALPIDGVAVAYVEYCIFVRLDLRVKSAHRGPAMLATPCRVGSTSQDDQTGSANLRQVIDLQALLAPRSIALVGASEGSSWSQALVANFASLGFQGRFHLVHPPHSQLFGLPCHGSLTAIPDEVDSAYVMTGTVAASEVVEDCGRNGVRSMV